MTHIDEDELRRGLRELADTDGTAGAVPPAGAVVALGRRTRHRRRALAAGAATALVAAGSVLGVRWTGGPAPSPDSVAAVTGSGDTAASSRGGDPSRPRPVGWEVYPPQPRSKEGEPLDTGPRSPVENVRYRYDLSPICGLRYAVFGGRVWEAEKVPSPPSWVSDRAHGFMRLVDDPGVKTPVAVFEFDAPNPRTIVFRPLADETRAGCLAEEPPRRYSDAPAATVGPAKPVDNAQYPYDWPTGCDKRYLVFGGRLWETQEFPPGTLEDLVHDLPTAAQARLMGERILMTVESPLFEATLVTWAYLPVDRINDEDRARCPDVLDQLERIARETAS